MSKLAHSNEPAMDEIEAKRAEREDFETCPDCGGEGYVVEIQPACCGNYDYHSGCRGDCAVPEEVQVACQNCCGEGRVPSEPAHDAFEAEAERDTEQAIRIGKQQRAMFDGIFNHIFGRNA